MPFSLYVALGDSMSTDHYPTCDVRDLDVPPIQLDPLGAASLFYRNDDTRWPEFSGRDLLGQSPGLEFRNLAEDGAMIDDVATEELARVGHDSEDPGILITLTDGTGRLPGLEAYGTLPLEYLDRFNQQVRETARMTPNAVLADVQKDFLG